MIEILKNLLGKPIHHQEVISFLEENGYKIPKKLSISNRKEDSSYWLTNKKLKMDLLFETEVHRDDYEFVVAEKKGMFYPILTDIRIYGGQIEMPFGLSIGKKIGFQKIVDTFGDYTTKSSDIANIWLDEDGNETWYEWSVEEDTNSKLHFRLNMLNETINEIWFSLLEDDEIFTLYYPRVYETFETFCKNMSPYKISRLLFLRWAIENDWVQERGKTSAVVKQIKKGEASVLDFIKELQRGYIARQDFIKEKQYSVRKYINRIDVEVGLTKEVYSQFLIEDELERYLSKDIENKLAEKLTLAEENYQKLKAIWDKKFLGS